MSDGRVAFTRRLEILLSNTSPTLWPMVSFTSFKLSRSTKSTAVPDFTVRLRSSASASLRKNNTRLGRPVSASCVAWRVSSSCSCLVSVMSRAMALKCCTTPLASRTTCKVRARVRTMPSGLRKPNSPSHLFAAGWVSVALSTSRGTWSRIARKKVSATVSLFCCTSLLSTPTSERAPSLQKRS